MLTRHIYQADSSPRQETTVGRLFLGVDGGNSKTDAVVCDESGTIAGYGRSGNGDIYGARTEQAAVDSVLGAVADALDAAGTDPAGLAGSAFRLAGVDWPEDHAFWMTTLAEQVDGLHHVSVDNDGFAAIRCGQLSGVGVGVMSGTGPAISARGPGGPAGTAWSVCFWVQHPLGASGLVHEGLRAVYRSEIGLGPATTLKDSLLAFFGQDSVEDMLHEQTRRGGRLSVRSSDAAREVTRAATDGDPVAREIVTRQGVSLAEYARVAAGKVGFAPDTDEVPVVIAGSVLAGAGSPVTEAVLGALEQTLPRARPVQAAVAPVFGAALDALAEAGIDLTPAVVEQMRETAPPGADSLSAQVRAGLAEVEPNPADV